MIVSLKFLVPFCWWQAIWSISLILWNSVARYWRIGFVPTFFLLSGRVFDGLVAFVYDYCILANYTHIINPIMGQNSSSMFLEQYSLAIHEP